MKLWAVGASGQPPGLKRQIMLSYHLGLLGAIATLPYQFFYVIYDWALYWPVFSINLVFMAVYASTLAINRAGHPHVARNLVLTNACIQFFVLAYFIGAGSGAHLYYFMIVALLALIFYRYRTWVLVGLGGVVAGLFVFCELVFSEARTPLPEPLRDIVYVGSAVAAMMLTAGFCYVFRVEIDRAEAELTDSNRDLEKLSTTDELTRLINRRGMDAFLDQEWGRMRREGGALSLLMCDVDYFKAYNDYYGHQQGDEVLRRIAAVLEDAARRPSDMVARYGGEEFVLILPHTDESEGRFVSERILGAVHALAIPHTQPEADSVITVSVGFSTMTPDLDMSARQLLMRADRALYEAKRSGRNCIAFEPAGLHDNS